MKPKDKQPEHDEEPSGSGTIPVHREPTTPSTDDSPSAPGQPAATVPLPAQVAHALATRHDTFVSMSHSYRSLVTFLGFVMLFLVVLYLQRDAKSAYEVQETLAQVVTPSDNTFQDSEAVLGWLGRLLETVWVDPACGDGDCDAPWEFPSYSNFGCRADCGRLIDELPGLTTLQVDLYWDFTHPVGSIPSSDLMQQATWNLCPLDDTPPSSSCYFDTDQGFTTLSGELHINVDDVPDGEWTLQVKRDLFNKVRGAVRDGSAIIHAAYYDKLYIAAAAALAEHEFEEDTLRVAVDVGQLSVFEYVANQLSTGNISNADMWDVQNVVNATCVCSAAGLNGTGPLTGSTWPDGNGEALLFDPAVYARVPRWQLTVNRTVTAIVGCGVYSDPVADIPMLVRDAATGSVTTASDQAAWCSSRLALLKTWADQQWAVMRALLVDRRLGDIGRSSGKRFARNSLISSLQSAVARQYPEKLDPIFNMPQGVDPVNAMVNARLTELAAYWVEPFTYFPDALPPTAMSLLTRTNVYRNPNVTMPEFALRAALRLQEVLEQQQEMLVQQVPLYPPASSTVSVALIMAVYNASGANTTWLPPNSALVPPLNVTYNYVQWNGSPQAYLTCNLGPRSLAMYNGTCQPAAVSCTPNPDENRPWNCTVPGTGQEVPGTLSLPEYRAKCEIKCEELRNCNGLCECLGACSSTEMCVCNACLSLNMDAAADYEFNEIRNSTNETRRQSEPEIAPLPQDAGRRRLLQVGNASAEQLTEVLRQINMARMTQQSVATSLSQLQAQVAATNAVAEQRAKDRTVQNMLAAARSDLSAAQKATQEKLDIIMKRQQKINEAVGKAAESLQAIADLKQKMLASQQNMENALAQQLEAIQVAYGAENIINLYQALELWKRTRLQRNLTEKSFTLANAPCNAAPTVDNPFALSRAALPGWRDAHRRRGVGLSNRLVGGLLLHTWRVHEVPCSRSQFDELQSLCTGGVDTRPYGVDPTFKLGSALYNPDLDDAAGEIVVQYYNCSQLAATPTYNVTNPDTLQVTNQVPYCGELYNPRHIPWGFYMFPMKQLPNGFPVWFDIDLSAEDAATWFSYVKDGLYLDEHNRELKAFMVTYNQDMKVFASIQVRFHFSDSGSIMARTHIYTLSVEMYESTKDMVRMGLEMALSIAILAQLFIQVYDIAIAYVEQGNPLKYFVSAWSWVDLASNALLVATACLWWFSVKTRADQFDIAISHPVYQELRPDAKHLTLADGGAGLRQYWDAYLRLQYVINQLNWYFSLNGINILLLLARILKLMHFQPRLGIVTRSLALAGPDLIHFALVFGMVFVGYSMLAHLIFGNVIHQFGTFGESINTCFEILLGNIAVSEQLRELSGLQNLAGTLFFWSYELLVFMVLLNFLLAIIVDAFAEVNSEVKRAPTLYQQLARMFRSGWDNTRSALQGQPLPAQKVGNVIHRMKQYKQLAGSAEQAQQAQHAKTTRRKLKVMDHEVDEATLQVVLEECLKESPYYAPEDEPKKSGWLGGKGPPLNAAELHVAAKFVVERFGEEVAEEDEELRAAADDPAVAMFSREDDQLTQALLRLAEVQSSLSNGQWSLMSSQQQLAEQQANLASMLDSSKSPQPSTTSGADK